jgi:hypothetical protein
VARGLGECARVDVAWVAAMIADLQNQAATAQFSATLGTESEPGDFQTERHDWQLFRTLEITRK